MVKRAFNQAVNRVKKSVKELLEKNEKPRRVKFWALLITAALFMTCAYFIIAVIAAAAISPAAAEAFAKEGLEFDFNSVNAIVGVLSVLLFWGGIGAYLAILAYGHADTRAKNIWTITIFALGAPFAVVAVLLLAVWLIGMLLMTLLTALVMGLILAGAAGAGGGDDDAGIPMSNNSDYAIGTVRENGRYMHFVDEFGREHQIEHVDKSGATPIITAHNGQKYEKVAGYDDRWVEKK